MKQSNTAERLKTIMQERNLKQTDILEKAQPYCETYGVKLRKNDLSQYVNGKVEPGQKKLSILAKALNVSEAWLMGYNVSIEPSIDQTKNPSSELTEREKFIKKALSLDEEKFKMINEFLDYWIEKESDP